MTKFHPATLVRELLRSRRARLRREPAAGAHREGRRGRPRSTASAGTSSARRRPTRRARSGARHPRCTPSTARASPTRSTRRRRASRLDVLLQVNLTDDPAAAASRPTSSSRSPSTSPGSRRSRCAASWPSLRSTKRRAAAFERLRGYADRVRAIVPDATWISAGMTADFAEAIAAGATHLRIGSAITGPRPAGVNLERRRATRRMRCRTRSRRPWCTWDSPTRKKSTKRRLSRRSQYPRELPRGRDRRRP